MPRKSSPSKHQPTTGKAIAPAPTAPGLHIEARVEGTVHSVPLNFNDQKLFQQRAIEWSRLASQHQQWADRSADVAAGRQRASEAIQESGVSPQNLALMSQADVLQVCVPFVSEEEGWEQRVMPWEYVIVQALKHIAPNQKTPSIVRHLMVQGNLPSVAAPTAALGVIECPKETEFDLMRTGFLQERQLVATHLAEPAMKAADNPTAEKLAQLVQEQGGISGSLILHLLTAQMPRSRPGSSKTVSHLWLPRNGSDVGASWMPFEEAPAWLTNQGKVQPRLIALSFCYSGPRLAGLATALGAHAAIGFQDFVTDEVCSNFFSLFYKTWRLRSWNLLAAFNETRRELSGSLGSTSVILWSRHSLFTMPAIATPPATAKRKSAVTATPVEVVQVSPLPLTVDAQVNDNVNYSVLHNQHFGAFTQQDAVNGPAVPVGLFSKFSIQRAIVTGAPIVADIEVRLYAGDTPSVWRKLEVLDKPSKDLTWDIRVPLTSGLARGLIEGIRTTVEASVKVDGRVCFRQTYNVTLLAIAEWRDDGVCHVWLPSFVLPRDPVIATLVRQARKCLCALTDDFSASFDGYQSGDPIAVDRQVQALWSTIIQELQLGYINPPPTFTAVSQRLRRPSDLMRERAGTCIDLALLLAACLEQVDIRPFLVLEPGHAYVGYCRTEWSTEEMFSKLAPVASNAFPAPSGSQDELRQTSDGRYMTTWVYGREHHPDIVAALNGQNIGALEATGLTKNLSFAQAREQGDARLRRRLNFEWLIDVRHARLKNVTPLPLNFEPER